jgi:Spy/CpxP family protein refolding chaperone
MPMRLPLTLLLAVTLAGGARAQEETASGPVPAGAVLALRSELGLDSAQVRKLEDLARAQRLALDKSVAAYLRSEADLLDASRSDDAAVRRIALERRSKVAIDAEVARVKAESDSRAVLTARQSASYAALAGRATGQAGTRALWQALVSPTALAAIEERPDSGEVRISVTPNYVDIYLGDEKKGTGRKYLMLPVGRYQLRLFAVGCDELVVPVEVQKGPPVVVSRTLTCK